MKWLSRLVIQRAIATGSSRFAMLGVVIAVLRVVRKLAGADSHTVYRRELKPGDVLVIREPQKPR